MRDVLEHQQPKAPPRRADILPTPPGLRPLPIQSVLGEYQNIRRVEYQEYAEPVRGFQDAIDRVEQDSTDATAIVYIAVEVLRDVEEANKQRPGNMELPLWIVPEYIADTIYLGEPCS